MLAISAPLPIGPQWAYEVKWDGFRAIFADGRFIGRSGRVLNGPPMPRLDPVLGQAAVLDGELVALDSAGLPSFNAMQSGIPPTYFAFDLIVPELTYVERRQLLEELDLTISPSFADGPATVAAAQELGLEGVVAKRKASRYQPGVRSPDWVKWKFIRTGDFVIGGWRPGARRLGALLVGTMTEEGLRYRGRVGGGITARTEATLLPVLSELARPSSPFVGPTEQWPTGQKPRWVEPLLVVEVRYSQITPDGRLRFPVFLRMRPDKLPTECVEDGAADES